MISLHLSCGFDSCGRQSDNNTSVSTAALEKLEFVQMPQNVIPLTVLASRYWFDIIFGKDSNLAMHNS